LKAILSRSPGPPETLVLEEIADPVAGRGEAVVLVRACAVNYPDVLVIEDKYQFRPPRPFSPGGEIAGVVESVGEGVANVAPGARVIGFQVAGGMAEKALYRAEALIALPDAMDFDVGAALTVTYGTSIHGLKDRAKLKAGETLLVLGAAGGVGLAAVELGKAMGAKVVAAVSSEDKAALAKAHGADAAVVYPQGPFDKDGKKALSELFKSACGPDGANVIYDPVGGDYAEAALRAIAWEGRYLVVGFPAGIPSIPLNLTLLKGCQIIGVFWGAFLARDPKGHAANIAELMRLWGEGKIQPEVSERFPLARGGEAIALLASRRAKGKVVVVP
jgi:NADPH2:quinone reductase